MTYIEKPECELIGQDGNVFNLMGIASKTLKKAGLRKDAEEMVTRIMNEADDYSAALDIIADYVEVV